MKHPFVAREPNAVGSILIHRSPAVSAIGVNVPVAPRRRFIVMVEKSRARGALLDLRLLVRWVVTKEPCRCGSGVMRDLRYFGCAVCTIPREPLIERARLYPGRAV